MVTMSDSITPVQVRFRLPDVRTDELETLVWGGLIGDLPVPDGAEEQAGDVGMIHWVLSWLDPPPDDEIEGLLRRLEGLGADEVAVQAVAHDAGLESWRAHARAWKAGPFVVRPPWLAPAAANGEAAEGTIDLVIDPGAVFGSGSHQSTRMAIELLAGRLGDWDRVAASATSADAAPVEVIDIGSGSGILGIASALLDVRSVDLVELDPDGQFVGLRNATLNRVDDRVRWAGSDVTLLDAPLAPVTRLILANLLIGEHEEVAPWVRKAAGNGGIVVAAGILEHQEDRLIEALAPAVTLERIVESSETDPSVSWAALVVQIDSDDTKGQT